MEQNATFAHFITPIKYELLNFSRKNIKFCSDVYMHIHYITCQRYIHLPNFMDCASENLKNKFSILGNL